MIAPIEIKVNIDDDVAHALDVLGCPPRPTERHEVWFAEARSADERTPLPLLSSHISIAMRTGDHDDVTVRLRPCPPGRLVGKWLDPFSDADFRYHLHEDWCGSDRALAASAVSRRTTGSVAAAMAAGTDPAQVLDSAQRQFLVTCSPAGVPIDHLMRLGPIDSSRWKGIAMNGLDLTVERWTVPDADLLEISTILRPRPGESVGDLETRALTKQLALRSMLTEHGMRPSATDAKTFRVLCALAREWA
ncbi:hypothetical protein AAFP30_14555 [Gordonia sp. CPCC 205515]|uniref:hypothetical protein n=1 Tax=Gordonia sp. CPCC 205515 TaxID=3140791 RepID=UPI003AF34368